jgi:thiamine pyrophosphate-dependent acetolactate synthase large subunit-like protein/nitrite reductase/ring-hydroxylating ferredoxin subunit
MSELVWHKVLENKQELEENRVMTVWAGHKGICLTHFEGKYSALDNACPHQGGPLGEGSIENGLLRCPWHGWDYHPCDGKSPGYDDGAETYEVKIEGDHVYVGLEPEPEHETTVSDIMMETMTNWGIDTVFGMVGHSNLGVADAMRRQEEKGNLKFYGIRHEGAASFAASAYGKLTGKPAACFAIAGPGATNMYTGMWDAKVDRAPLLALSGQVDTQVVGTNNFQELDLVGAFQTVAEFNHRVLGDSKHAHLMSLAIKTAILKRDVSHLTFPDEVQIQKAKKNEKSFTPEDRITEQDITPPKASLDKAVAMINESASPVIIVGHGAKFSMDEITLFAEKMKCPVVTTFKAKGQISDHHHLGCGVLGRSGTPIASYFMNEADLLIVFGSSFSKHTGITAKKQTIQVDYDPLVLSKHDPVECAVYGEISTTAKLFLENVKQLHNKTDRTEEIARRWVIWRDEKSKRRADDHGDGVNAAAVFDSLSRLVDEDAVMCADVGNNAYSFGRYFECRDNRFLMSGYLGSIGFAFPAAMGAWAAVKGQKQIIAVAGDGGFGQYLAELNTAVKYNMPIKTFIINNFEIGKIAKEQRASKFDVWQTKLSNPSFADYANNCGALGLKVESLEEIDTIFEKALAHDGPVLVEIISDVNLF